MHVSIVIPVFNGAATLRALVEQIEAALTGTVDGLEILLVDDRSTDSSWAEILDLASERSNVVGLRLTRNFGEQSAVLCGIRKARNGVIVTLDDDLQNPPEEIPVLLAAVSAGADLVYGVPETMRQPGWRRVGAATWRTVAEVLLRIPRAREQSSFRAFQASLRNAFDHVSGPTPVIDSLLRWSSQRAVSVTVRHEHRRSGRSNYKASSLAAHTSNLVTSQSIAPLRIAWFTCLALVGGTAITAIAALSADGARESWWVATVVLATGTVLSGLLGILGEYLGPLHFRLLGVPAYTVGTSTEEMGLRRGPRGAAAEALSSPPEPNPAGSTRPR